MSLSLPLRGRAALALGLLGGCSVPNPNHCAVLEGDATCRLRSGDTPHCSLCVGENDGCVADPVETVCAAATAPLPATTTGAPTTGDPATTDPSTSAGTSTGTTDPTTGDPTTGTSTGDTGTSTDDTGTDDTSTGTTTTTDTSTGTTTTSDGESTTGDSTTTDTSTGDPMCGDDVAEGDEICDGADVNGLTCKQSNPVKFNGGAMKCNADCSAYDDSKCCLASGQLCGNGIVQPCCAPFTCQGLLEKKCL
jgi:hypothetical protein